MINDGIFLLAIRGQLKSGTLDEARKIHNETAGNPDGVAAARSLGDLSHNVYVPFDNAPDAATELLILDTWTSPQGLQQFFSDPQVQAGGDMIFESRDPVVWSQSGFGGFVHPTPKNRNERYVGMIRGTVKSRAAAKEAFDEVARRTINSARLEGQVSHQMYWRLTAPGEDESLELIGIDVWMDADGMNRFYSEPPPEAVNAVFASRPETSIWKQPAGEWVEW